MHWLPLVAMVIASALPFPHSPVASTVAAVTEHGKSLDNHTKHIDDSIAPLPAPQTPVDYNSHSNASYKDYNMTVAPGRADSTQHSSMTGVNKEFNYPSKIKEKLQTLEGRKKQRQYQSKSSFHTETTNSAGLSVDSNTEGERLRRTVGSRHRDSPSQDNYLLEDYESESTRPGDDSIPHHSVHTRTDKEAGRTPSPSEESLAVETELGLGALQGEDELLFLDAHPRVLFSPSASPPKHPPLLLMLETGLLAGEGEDRDEEEEVVDADGHTEGHGDRETDRSVPLSWVDTLRGVPRPAPRLKRSGFPEKSVCEQESDWVMDKQMAIDNHGRTVSIVPYIKTSTGRLKQYFYETTCRKPERQRGAAPPHRNGAFGATLEEGSGPLGVNGSSCLGVDKKQWVSQCKAKQTYVRALTADESGRQGWRWIRINSSCVCVLLSRVNKHHKGGL